jgi:membrane complex biogenesis BtpA family protein
VTVFPPKPNSLEEIFGRRKVLIGVIHSRPLPGSPHYRGEPLEEVYAFAIQEGQRYRAGGFHGLIVENAWDIPFSKPEDLGFETAASMAAMTQLVREEVGLPVGVNVLANGVLCALAVAKAAGGSFVRANQWVNAYVANEGIVEGPAPAATRYRSWLKADDVKVFADVHVKHGSHAIVADRDVAEQARDAEFFDADVLIATGQRTGSETQLEEIDAMRVGTRLPVIVGSGVNLENARSIFSASDGAIVASAMKEQGVWWNPVSRERVESLARIAGEIWT